MNFPFFPFQSPISSSEHLLFCFVLFITMANKRFPEKTVQPQFRVSFQSPISLTMFLIMNYINEKSVFSCFEFRFTLRECQRKFFLHSPVFVISFVILTSISVIQNMQPCIYMKYFPGETL